MQRSEQEELISAITATAEVMGTKLQPVALMMMTDDLADFPLDAVLAALKRCRREMSGRLTLAAIIERVHAADGMPGADEAWALASRGEDDTVVITEQIAEAMQIVRPLLGDGDAMAARMAFRETYTRIINEAREKRIKPKWFVSLGHDRLGRALPIADAVRAGKIDLVHSLGLLSTDERVEVLKLTGHGNHPLVQAHQQAALEDKRPLDTEKGLKHIAHLKAMLRVKSVDEEAL